MRWVGDRIGPAPRPPCSWRPLPPLRPVCSVCVAQERPKGGQEQPKILKVLTPRYLFIFRICFLSPLFIRLFSLVASDC